MNYSEMSGYEINNRIHNIVACEGKYDLKVEGYKVTWTERETGRVIETLRKQYDKEFKDYLSSWADAGPIIQEYLIALKPVPLYVGGYRWFATEGDGLFGLKAVDNNPLRAAMMLFLAMQEKANA
ncbi:DUF2591 domain-containing protein [Pantoea agglomerans]|uniref:phage protein NinX family protein n=1 Tax=Enterobacter agglomerans TaxID=549 RepID=UPI0013B703E4|nr:phage protein NinX family protein [Pantoea agglomerans]NEG85082.1 DUF2591 domain-containing protein [Pantoea agglomerans]NEH07029.1 DUF2591 domain-containing protein [Pantoea agglomerans]